MGNTKLSIQDMVSVGLCTALIAILAQITIPMPSGVPLTFQTFAIVLTSIVLGAKNGALAAFLYVLLGAIGVPVLAGFRGGLQSLVGPTGGFLLSFPIMAFLIGLGAEQSRHSPPLFLLLLISGTVLNYVVGVLVFCPVTQSNLLTGITVCVLPFLPTSLIQIVIAAGIGLKLKERLTTVQVF